MQYFLYYYNGGKEFEKSLDEQAELSMTDPPNGIHRYRLRAGLSFKPIPRYKPLSLVFYYATQREFNIQGFGNDLNIEVDYQNKPLLPFNNFNIIGIQASLIFN